MLAALFSAIRPRPGNKKCLRTARTSIVPGPAALGRGEGGALLVRGEAGIGKTTLLETLAALAERAPPTGTR